MVNDHLRDVAGIRRPDAWGLSQAWFRAGDLCAWPSVRRGDSPRVIGAGDSPLQLPQPHGRDVVVGVLSRVSNARARAVGRCSLSGSGN